MIQGAQKFIESDYKISQPEIVKQAIKTYRAENNWIQNYLFECCETDRAYSEKAGELYNNYRDYCINTGESIKSCSALRKAMIEAGYGHKTNSRGSFYSGVRIKQFRMPYINPPSMVEDGGEIDNFSENDLEFYINTLHLHEELTIPLMEYNAFTDIEFNPQKSINCQAEAAAVYVSLSKQGLLEEALKNKDSFMEIVYSV